MNWSSKQDAKLKELWLTDLTTKEIGIKIGGKSKNAVCGRAYRLGLPVRRNPKEVEGVEIMDAPIFGEGCQWIQGDPKDRNFCGKLTNGGSWCEEHHARVFRKIEVGQAA